MQKNRLNSSAENSGKKKAAEQILISTHNAAIKDIFKRRINIIRPEGGKHVSEKRRSLWAAFLSALLAAKHKHRPLPCPLAARK